SPLFWSAMTLGALDAAGEDLFVTQRTLTQATERAVFVVAGPPGGRTADEVPAGCAGAYEVRPGYALTVTPGPGGPTARVPTQPPIPLLAGDGGRLVLEGLATELTFNAPGAARLRQGAEEWGLATPAGR